MSYTATTVAVTVFQISLAFGALMWRENVINCLLQNRPARLVLSGSQATALGNALKVPMPSITWELCTMGQWAVIAIQIITIVSTMKLVEVLNVAFGRGYEVRVRYRKHGPGVVDDELIFELIP